MAFAKGWGAPWGKADAVHGSRHHLAHHCADVAACFEAICAQPVIRARLERAAGQELSDLDMARLAALVFLHDCGKLHPGFQAKGWPDGMGPGYKTGHLEAGAAIFSSNGPAEIADHLHLKTLGAWGVEQNLIYCVLAHHGRPFKMEGYARNGWNKAETAGYDPLAAAREMGEAMRAWFGPAFEEGGECLPKTADFQHYLCGLVTLADWLGSTERIFSYAADFDTAYMSKARREAHRAVQRIGLNVGHLRVLLAGRTDFATLTGGLQSRPVQEAIGTFATDEQLVILESETGSGKTEAALWRFVQLLEAGKVDSLYFALPTRAAAKQIHGRVIEAMRHVFGDDAPEPILAVPGYFKAGDHEGEALPGWKVRWDDDDGLDERLLLSRWAAESSKRYLAATVAVGTVDQAMLAGLQVKHAHLRAAGLSRALLVIDEIHASDRYMSEVQAHVLKTHVGRGGHALLMSATLGSVARVKWLAQNNRAASPGFDEAICTPYPAIWGQQAQTPIAPSSGGRDKRVSMILAPSWGADEASRHAITAARGGAKVLIIRNTVAAALDTLRAVKEAGAHDCLWQVKGGPALHHARFAAEDRTVLDTHVEVALSPKQDQRPSGGLIVIGTQTLEQSLDIDADFLITDLCPADVLLQRIGRLHRHTLPRPQGFEAPRCVVLAPTGGLDRFTAPKFENGLGSFRGGGGIYQNLHACELTRRLIVEQPEWAIPAMNRFLVESATHEDKIDALNAELGAVWAKYWSDIYGREIAEAGAARNVALQVDKDFVGANGNPMLFASDEEKIRTRLGAEGVQITFAKGTIGPFGGEISSITLPAHWSRGLNAPEYAIAPERDGETLRFALGETGFSYGREGLEKVKS